MSVPEVTAPDAELGRGDSRDSLDRSVPTPWYYEFLRDLVRGEALPLAIVDLDRFESNVRQFAGQAESAGKTIRVASKSIRVPDLLQRLFACGGPVMQGVMCYSAEEAGFLAAQGLDDLLVGYPTSQASDVAIVHRATQSGKKIALIVDCQGQVERLASLWSELGGGLPLRVCIEADVSWRPLGLHIGAQRSPIRSLEALGKVLDSIASRAELHLAGFMSYESHLAGIPDYKPFALIRNLAVRGMKAWGGKNVIRQRLLLAEFLQKRGITFELVNGGGTGSFLFALRDPWLSEVTVGSGLLQPHLFDGYNDVLGQPALLFALPVARLPQHDRVTCHSGGFIASGASSNDRSPLPVLPEGLRVDLREGCGEVQTPLVVPTAWQGKLNLGDPIFFRPAKSGELAEHFGEYLLLQDGRIVDRVKTYRGLGFNFH